MFLAACLCGVGAALVWRRHCPVLPAQPAGRPSQKAGGKSPLLLPLVWAILLAIVLQGMLRDGITTWMPVYIDQTFRLGSTFSIFSGTVLPLFSLAAIQGASWLHRRAFPNPILCAGVIFGLGAFCGAGLALFPGASPALSIGLSALLTGCMHGINLLLIGVLPAYFKKFGQVSLLSGVLNAFVYVGSALSAYGFAAAAELSGWGGRGGVLARYLPVRHGGLPALHQALGAVPERIGAPAEKRRPVPRKGKWKRRRQMLLFRFAGPPYFTAMASISQSTPLGRAFTATQLRAGLEVKYSA